MEARTCEQKRRVLAKAHGEDGPHLGVFRDQAGGGVPGGVPQLHCLVCGGGGQDLHANQEGRQSVLFVFSHRGVCLYLVHPQLGSGQPNVMVQPLVNLQP